jgi:tRNA threonylcarbamoyl adenosine modification protein YeaZ
MSADLLLAVDTATRVSVVAVGQVAPAASTEAMRSSAAPRSAVSRRAVEHRHGSQLLEQIEEVLASVGADLEAVAALAVGSGPGSFTGLRVGLATAKTLAHVRGLPLVGVPTSTALRHGAVAAGAPGDVAIVLPAGAHDHYLARVDGPAQLIAPGALAEALGTTPAATVDSDVLGEPAARIGAAAVAGLPEAIMVLARDRLARGERDDVAGLVPAYVALPRGIPPATAEMAWSPDLR